MAINRVNVVQVGQRPWGENVASVFGENDIRGDVGAGVDDVSRRTDPCQDVSKLIRLRDLVEVIFEAVQCDGVLIENGFG